MKITDLQLGDWVKYVKGNITYYRKVRALDDGGTVVLNVGVGTMTVNIDKLTPIDITEELLFKNEFTFEEDLEDSYYVSKDRRVVLCEDTNSNKRWYVHIDNADMDSVLTCEINYLHELQHCYGMAEMEKEFLAK